MRAPIRKKITLIIVAVALGGILLSGLTIHYSLNRQFQFYLRHGEQARQDQIVQALADIYVDFNGWGNLPPRMEVSRGIMAGGLRFVTDNQGNVVLSNRREMMMPNSSPLMQRPIVVNGVTVGTAFFGRTVFENLLSQQDQLFRNTINRSILITLLFTAVLAFGVALVFAQRLSAPILEMNRTARAMTDGHLDSRINTLPQDELGELGASLNNLASRLKEADTLRKQMTADVAHDLRTPLATIRSYLEGMIDQVIPASPENLESLLDEVKRLTGLITDLQEIAQADLAIRHFHPETLELRDFLAGMAQRLTPVFQEKNQQLTLVAANPVTIETDRNALTKIMDNLISNAHKYTPPGKTVRIEIETTPTAVQIQVRDEGIGISAKDLPYIFERFYRSDPSRNRESGGFGLGLTIVKELTEGLGGTVTAASVPGQGSTFTVTLPLA